MAKGNRVELRKDRDAQTVWGGNGFGTKTSSARWRVWLDGVETSLYLRAEERGFGESSPAWSLGVKTADGRYLLPRKWYPRYSRAGCSGGVAAKAKTWVRENPEQVEALVGAAARNDVEALRTRVSE